MELEYTPTSPKQQPAPKSEFVLVNDLTGKPLPKRGPQILKAVHQDKDGKSVNVDFKVPYPPRPNCKQCRGRGYIGFVVEGGERRLNLCQKCYPVNK
jgi:hypothetical protein